MTDARKVPREPTQKMRRKGLECYEEYMSAEFRESCCVDIFQAMYDAAPPARECAPPFDKTWLIAALNVHRHLGVPPRDSDFMLWKRENDKWLGEAVAALREYAGLAAGAAPAAEPCYYCGRVHSEADPYCVKPAAEPAPDEYMCPNCVTPWKCNGPHIDRTLLREDQEREDAK